MDRNVRSVSQPRGKRDSSVSSAYAGGIVLLGSLNMRVCSHVRGQFVIWRVDEKFRLTFLNRKTFPAYEVSAKQNQNFEFPRVT